MASYILQQCSIFLEFGHQHSNIIFLWNAKAYLTDEEKD